MLRLSWLTLAVAVMATVGLQHPLSAEVKLIGTVSIPGTARDRSGLTDELGPGLPHDLLSGGSGIAYTGQNDRYLVLPDRGPGDGAYPYACRWHFARIRVHPEANPPVSFELEKTTLLFSESGEKLTGSAQALDPTHPARSLRFDPEGVRLGRDGAVFLSDEYGPYVAEFNLQGKRVRTFKLPAGFPPQTAAAEPKAELAGSKRGRQPNSGLEGLAISPRGDRLFAIIQKPLIQDGALDAEKRRVGTNLRIAEIDIASGKTREFVYPLESADHGVSEILAINDHALLVLERDGLGGVEAKAKQLFRIDLAGCTDVSGIESLPSRGVPQGVRVASKELFLDLLDPRFKLAGAEFPEKIEGICFGPDLADGRHLLIVTGDNDFRPEAPNRFYAFAIPAADLPGYVPQQFEVARKPNTP
ncbi:MAG TPA: esterase-like activity of phytase family protein [Planctomycetaceae bacterium]|nr:esterase-like activity of phytase family protein [Planctomycetaceae bacterium]